MLHPQVSPQLSIRPSQFKKLPIGLRKGPQPRGVSPAMTRDPCTPGRCTAKSFGSRVGHSPNLLLKGALPNPGLAPTIAAAFGLNRGKREGLTHLQTLYHQNCTCQRTLFPCCELLSALGKLRCRSSSQTEILQPLAKLFSSFLETFFMTITMPAKLTGSISTSSRQLISDFVLCV